MRVASWRRAFAVALLLLIFVAACSRREETPPAPTVTLPVATAAGPAPAATGASVTPLVPSPAATEAAYLPLVRGEESPTPLPVIATATATPPPTETPPAYPTYAGPPLARNLLGIQLHIHREDYDVLFDWLEELPVGWVKVQVSWKLYEPSPGQLDAFRIDELDRFIARARAAGLQVLLSVAKAPEWSRPTTEMDGPPADYAAFTRFMQALAGRYQGQVAAYELWNEPNLQREWNGEPLSAARTAALIQAGAQGVAAADPGALLISAAPATTGIDDGVTAIDDRRFLREMVAAGLLQTVDGVGVHPYGWANPPDASAAAPDAVSPSHNNHPSFFFADTLHDYRAILVEAGYPVMPLWSTEFGWASYEGMEAAPPSGAEYMAHVNEWQQAAYTLRALALAEELHAGGPLFLWNLNFAPTFGNAFTESAYSILRPDGRPRPLFLALQALETR